MEERHLLQLFGSTPATASRTKWNSLRILYRIVTKDDDCRIQYPNHEEMDWYSQLIQNKYHLLEGCIGVLDGTIFEIKQQTNFAIQQKYYSGHHKVHCVNNILLFAPDGCIIQADTNYPGSRHDSWCARRLLKSVMDPFATPYGKYILADSAFPHTGMYALKVLTTLTTPERENMERRHALGSDTRTKLEQLARMVTSCRQSVEWGNRSLKAQFGRLKALPQDASQRNTIITCCLRLYNLRTRVVQINQIRTVFNSQLDESLTRDPQYDRVNVFWGPAYRMMNS